MPCWYRGPLVNEKEECPLFSHQPFLLQCYMNLLTLRFLRPVIPRLQNHRIVKKAPIFWPERNPSHPHHHFVLSHLAVTAVYPAHPLTSYYLFSSLPCLHTWITSHDRTALLTGSGSELLLQSRRGAQNTGFIPVRPIHYLFAPAPLETKWWI